MRYKHLLQEARKHFDRYPEAAEGISSASFFEQGGRWMSIRLQELRGQQTQQPDEVSSFSFYGWLKYGLCCAGTLPAAAALYLIHPVVSILSVVVFYCIEAGFLFLFPLLIDKRPAPLAGSIAMTHRVGFLNAVTNVIPIALFMLSGLLNVRSPFFRWQLGCMAVLIWYIHETRTRL
ncbi:hypothetical protein [Pedobacter sp. SYP-B3415]|uniref:hypothetical protein n=1 Tax=Pedobacter sp. SYP-B3415 TaxID=2496641 RepID=UPI00101DA995|nr:hypothetical protein [Pedobacter sp. SYP-B3415]